MKTTNIIFDSTTVEKFYQSVNELIGGERFNNNIIGKTNIGKVNLEGFSAFSDFNININEIELTKSINIQYSHNYNSLSLFLLIHKSGKPIKVKNSKSKELVFSPGQIVLYSNQNIPSFYIEKEVKHEFVGIRLDQEQLRLHFQNNANLLELILQSLKNDEVIIKSYPTEINHILSDLYQLKNKSMISRTPFIIGKGLELSSRLITMLIKEHSQNNNSISDTDIEFFHKIKDYLISDYSHVPTIASLSNEFNIGETKLKQNFKKIFGNSIYQFVTKHRMMDAHRLISMTQQPISSIAKEIGYSHLSKFSAVFKKHFEYTPSELRKNSII